MISIHIFFFKQKTAYEMRISDWSSDVCSSDLSSLTNVALLRTTAMLAKTRGFAAQTGDKVVPLSLIKRTQCYRGDGRGPVSWSMDSRSGATWSLGYVQPP